ncbi:MAG: TIGR04086 family membrane protein, partial [Clostridia bacterium]|nr:TIGR04086 family membrane protein [Clostridia bacterium]
MNIKGIFRGALTALIIAALVLVGAAAAVYFNLASERAAGIAVFAGAVVGVFFGAFCAAKTAGGKKLFNALAVSVIFMSVLLLISFVLGSGMSFNA